MASEQWQYSLGINNIFNVEPRRVMRRGQGNTNSIGAYSAAFLGTTFFVKATYTF